MRPERKFLSTLGPRAGHGGRGVELGGEGLRGVGAAHRVTRYRGRGGGGGGGGVCQRGQGDVASGLAAC